MPKKESKVEFGELYLWDLDYYHRVMLDQNVLIDHENIAPFFPAERTIGRMLNIFGGLLDVEFIRALSLHSNQAWHEDVRMFGVYKDLERTSTFAGTLYLAWHERGGRSQMWLVFHSHPGILILKGTGSRPVQPWFATSQSHQVANRLF